MAKFLFVDSKILNILRKDEKPSGGAAVQTYVWIRGLLSLGHEIFVAVEKDNGVLLKEECAHLPLITLYDPNKGIRWIKWVYYRTPSLYKSIKKLKPDFIYVSIPAWDTGILGIICKKLNIKLIVRLSSDILMDERFLKNRTKFHRFIFNLGLETTYGILCQNDYQLGMVKKKFPEKKTLKIPNPILSRGIESPLKYQERKFIAWLGLFSYAKNIKQLYEIASILPEEHFEVAGSNTPAVDDETREYLEKLKALTNVTFIGYIAREQVPDFLRKAKFLLNTSRYEGFSNTFLEAWSVGTPVLSSENVNPDNLIIKKKLGLIYKNNLDLQRQLEALEEPCYEEISTNALRYVKDHHDAELLATRLMDFLEDKRQDI